MPHIVARNYKLFSTPAKIGECEFLWFAKPLINATSTLVALKCEGREFLLEIRKKGENYIIKSDKITRISPNYLIKEALKGFCALAECDIVYDNLSIVKKSHIKKAEEFFKKIDFFIKDFPKAKEVWIEIGFGSGRHLLYQAQHHPEILFIGVEIHKPSIEQVLKQIAIKGLKNLYIIDYDARIFLEFVPSNIVGAIFLHFPVPWDKKPHRRVISKSFIKEAKRVLKPEGILELRTDSRRYFDYALDLFLQEDRVQLEVTKNIEPVVSSKYEDRWVRLGKDIYDIRMQALELSSPLKSKFDFKWQNLRFEEKIVDRFDTTPKIYENFFVHFERLYTIEPTKYLLEVSFGSFDRPEHKYIIISKEGASYYPTNPIPSQANIQSHKKIEELLHG